MIEHSAGGLVVRGDEILMIRDRFSRWTFPKGHIEGDETEAQAAIREVVEETGVRAAVDFEVGQMRYALPNGNEKQVTYYRMSFLGGEITPLRTEILDARWTSLAEAQALVESRGYPGYLALMRRALDREGSHFS